MVIEVKLLNIIKLTLSKELMNFIKKVYVIAYYFSDMNGRVN
ncbi:MAG: hypothetical protein OFPII_03950 [Osedax symbiont Rs1]|nr:MAG: hypothetical protein OFPII_03950 [Osedax symbiont Rs1]